MSIHPDPQNCCGCLACMDICSKEAISLAKDINGFIYPQVDPSACIGCGLCEKICALSKEHAGDRQIISAVAFKLKDRNALYQSTSGGVFTALSDYVLSQGGYVAGAVMKDDFSVQHIVTDDPIIRDRMRKSKYVQSNTAGIFKAVAKLLSDDKLVLFIGTPCQCAQMVRSAGVNISKLITCDFLCHGVPNNDFFKAHVLYLEKKYGQTATNYQFRGKKFGWSHMVEGIELGGRMVFSKSVQSYSRFFYAGLSLRPSCHNCVYRGMNHCTDLTMGDFWGIEKITGKKEKDGVSLLTSNTAKGEALLRDVLPTYGSTVKVPVEKVLHKFPSAPAAPSDDVNLFWKIYDEQGYDGVVEKFADISVSACVKWEIKKVAKQFLSHI